MTLGQLLKRQRDRIGKKRGKRLTQTEVAKACGVRQPTVCEWETDRTFPETGRLPTIARVYRVPAATLARLLIGA